MSKYVSYLNYFIAFICFILSCLFLILFLIEFYELINRCISVNRFSVSFFNCVQVFYFEILKTSLFIVVLFLLAILIMKKLTVPSDRVINDWCLKFNYSNVFFNWYRLLIEKNSVHVRTGGYCFVKVCFLYFTTSTYVHQYPFWRCE